MHHGPGSPHRPLSHAGNPCRHCAPTPFQWRHRQQPTRDRHELSRHPPRRQPQSLLVQHHRRRLPRRQKLPVAPYPKCNGNMLENNLRRLEVQPCRPRPGLKKESPRPNRLLARFPPDRSHKTIQRSISTPKAKTGPASPDPSRFKNPLPTASETSPAVPPTPGHPPPHTPPVPTPAVQSPTSVPATPALVSL